MLTAKRAAASTRRMSFCHPRFVLDDEDTLDRLLTGHLGGHEHPPQGPRERIVKESPARETTYGPTVVQSVMFVERCARRADRRGSRLSATAEDRSTMREVFHNAARRRRRTRVQTEEEGPGLGRPTATRDHAPGWVEDYSEPFALLMIWAN